MKILIFASIIASILFLPFILEESWQAPENLFYGKSRFHGTLTVDPKIPIDEIFLSIYYTAKDSRGTTYKSAWTDSIERIKIDKIDKIDSKEVKPETYKPKWKSFKIVGKYKNSNPPKPDEVFVVPYRIINGTLESIRGNDVEIIAVVNTTKSGIFELKFPRNFPYSNGPGDFPDNFFIGINGYSSDAYYLPETTPMMDHVRDKIINKINRPPPHPQTYSEKTDCYFLFSIPFYTYAKIGIHYGANGLIPDPYLGENVPEYCVKQTILPAKSVSPLQQSKSGVSWFDVKCAEDKVIVLKRNEQPSCVNFESAIRLYKRGIASNMENDVWYKWAKKAVQEYFEAKLVKSYNIEENSTSLGIAGVRESLPPYITIELRFTAVDVEEHQKTEQQFWFGVNNGDNIERILELGSDGKTKKEMPVER